MTFGEVYRAINSYNRQKREQAYFDYILADLIGRSVSRLYNSANTMPDISTAYPFLFDAKEIQEKKQAQQAELSALRFKLFANSYNQRFKEVGDKK